jgi:hypothetical protein
LDLVTSVGNDSVALTWLEEALEHAHAHGQIKTLAYLEWVMEDVVFVTEMAAAQRTFRISEPTRSSKNTSQRDCPKTLELLTHELTNCWNEA